MNPSVASRAVKYIAEVHGSREVTLYGKANLDYWREKLAEEQLLPYVVDGHARLRVIAVASRWMAVRFSEFILGVVTTGEPGGPPHGMLLLAGYNTSRPFTWVEYYLFSTPYSHANVDVDCDRTISMRLSRGTQTMLFANRVANDRPVRTEWVDSEGPAFLPCRGANASKNGKVYYVRLRGTTEISPFVAGVDTFEIKETASAPVLGWLVASDFAPDEWHLRREAHHARSKTYARNAMQ